MTTKTTNHTVRVLRDFSVILEISHEEDPTFTYILQNSRGDRLAFSNTVTEVVRMADDRQTCLDEERRQEQIDDLRAAINEAAGACEDMNLLTMALKVLTRK